ncbi:FimV/HubP family polar landmark protein [uncultured Xylophilus sp.]|uniref:FimV/HubP family polar landmark protein n=1 Tax=uncultured Xylophilus sp. TaxID=296832 RepID=UPI0025E10688|nr:FimV/HubP family polar landmark protein [uncultured Xylophilus sp.]
MTRTVGAIPGRGVRQAATASDDHHHRWVSATTIALVLGASLVAQDAAALSLGRMTVRSNLGEPLRAEIEVNELTAAEAESLSVQPASPAAFRAAGIEFNAALAGLQIAFDRSSPGRAVLRVAGSRPVNEPFLELLIEANWAGGRLSRNYTLLLDPPTAAANRSPAPVAPQLPPPAPPVVTAPAPMPPVRATVPAPAIAPAPPPPASPVAAPPPRAPAAARTAPVRAAPAPATSNGGQVTVRPGDTAGRIAASVRPPSVSLDQMLVALLQANPDAFIGGNVNRVRSGAVLAVPDAAQAAATPAPEARQIIVAQSRDFNEFRRRLAGRAPGVETAQPQRSAAGSVQTQVEDRRPAATTPDRLTLSKGTGRGGNDAEQQIAQASQARDNAARVAELSRNVNELNRLGVAATPTPTPAAAPPAPAAAPAPTPAAPASPPATATAPAPAPTPTAAPVAPPTAQAAPPAAAPAEDPLDSGPLGDPRVLGIVGLLVALLVALISYRTVQRRRAAHNHSSFLESKLPPDSFFGASGGQHVDTREGAPSSLATTYSPSQLDAGGDVDPLAEADVYLAYGRDLQAEEILKEALRNQPTRTALHAKLAEIYAKRKDITAFKELAAEAHRQTGGIGEDWQRIRALGEQLDPADPLFQAAAGGAGLMAGAAVGAAALTVAPPSAEPPPLDLEIEPPPPPPAPIAPPPPEPIPVPEVDESPAPPPIDIPPSLDLDFSAFSEPPPAPPPTAPAAAAEADPDFGLDFTLDEPPARPPIADAPAPTPAPADFDFGDLSLDIGEPPSPTPAPADTGAADAEPGEISGEDALATKLALAEEFNAIGDVDGARHLIEEVIAEASGSVRERAERMLASLQ